MQLVLKNAVHFLVSWIQGCRKLHAQTLWGDRRDQNKNLFSSNCMSDMCPCSVTDHQSESDL